MPDGTLKITKYVIFMLNQIESSARFPGRQVTSSTNHLKTSPGLEESEREEHATQRSPRPEVWGQCLYCEVHKGAPMHATCRGTGTPLSRKESGFVGLTDCLYGCSVEGCRGMGHSLVESRHLGRGVLT